jgi:protein-L-isoaspartate(D-aspartate) O-methyltransferase
MVGVGMKELTQIKEKLLERYVDEGIANSAKVIDAFMKVPREEFVPSNMRDSAYDDRPLPIAFGQTISAPHYLGLLK